MRDVLMRRSALTTALGYALLTGLWIFAVDLVVDLWITERWQFAELHVLHAALTVVLLFFLLRHDLRARERAERGLRRSYDELEQRVDERTAELRRLNNDLQKEISERRRAEAESQRLLQQYDRERRRAQTLTVEAQLRADELAAVFAAMTDAVVVYDAAGDPVRANPAAMAALGGPQPPEKPATRADVFRKIDVHGADGRLVPPSEYPSARALRGETVRSERLVFVNGDEHEATIAVSASPLYADGQISGAVALWHDLGDHERLIALEERQKLARELHDSLSQALYGISLGAHTALTLLDTRRERVVEALNYVVALADAGLTEMRALIFDLRPESLESEGLVNALNKQADALHARHGLDVAVEMCAEPDIPLDLKETIYRIAQQALHNAVKHAHAQRLAVRLARGDGGLNLEVWDDGVGFDPEAAYPGHLGLRSMRERAARCGGNLTIHSAPGQGTRVCAHFPLSAN